MKRKVLVVDDEADFLKIVKLNLEETGSYEVLTLLSAKDIVSKARAFKPDIILLDIIMPGIKGIEACEMLNNDPELARIPVVILSALEKDADKLKAFKVGVVGYMVKPIEKEGLINKIESFIRSANEK